MKTYLFFGSMTALANFVMILVLFLLGFHSDPAKFSQTQWINSIGGWAILIVGIVWGIRSTRAAVPPDQAFPYGRACGAGTAIAAVSAVVGIFTWNLYILAINPQFNQVALQASEDKMAAKGLSQDKIDAAEKVMRVFMSPVVETIFAFIAALVMGVVISLIAAAFLKRSASSEPPAVPAA